MKVTITSDDIIKGKACHQGPCAAELAIRRTIMDTLTQKDAFIKVTCGYTRAKVQINHEVYEYEMKDMANWINNFDFCARARKSEIKPKVFEMEQIGEPIPC